MTTRPVALVTGAGARLGRAFASYLAGQGYDLALHCSNNIGGIEQLKADLGKTVQTSVHRYDFSKTDTIKNLVPEANAAHKSNVSLLINNASVFPDAEFINFSDRDMIHTYAVNSIAPMLLSQSFCHHCRSGHIINILDARIKAKQPQRFVYSMSKHILYKATLHCARELAPEIRVNAICPGPILPPADTNQVDFDRVIAATPMNEKTHVYDLLRALDYLNKGQQITGEILFVDSGQHLN